jgi:mannitol operon transcriptional antiterminator
MYVEMAKIEAGITSERKKRIIVVCPTGWNNGWMLLVRIKNELPTLDVIDVLSIRDFNNKNFDSEIDAVITTSPSLSHANVQVISVNPLLERKDVFKIIMNSTLVKPKK